MTTPPNNPRHLDQTEKEGWSDFLGLVRRVRICSRDPKRCRHGVGDVNNPSPNDTGRAGGGQTVGQTGPYFSRWASRIVCVSEEIRLTQVTLDIS